MTYKRLFSLFVSLCVSVFVSFAQSSKNAYTAYIHKYKSEAVRQMNKYRIPASITLAQGLLESAAGESRLARLANNHFGIKASSDWTGPYILNNDDRPNEKFRKYGSVEQSYEDHSQFLLKPRYKELFSLDITDYRGWARGLKKCGYATNPRYADNLVSIIERYDLAQYDTKKSQRHPQASVSTEEEFLVSRGLDKCNGTYYIVAKEGDDLRKISLSIGKSKRRLRRYNEIPKGCDIDPGQKVYLGSKPSSNKAMKGAPHVVEAGESMYSIAQRYGVKMSSLYKINNLSSNYQPRVGDRIYLSK